MCSLIRASFSAHLQTLSGIGDQQKFRCVCAYGQSHQRHLCLSTNGRRYRWPEKVQMSLCICAISEELSTLIYRQYETWVTSEGSGKPIHMCSITRLSLPICKRYECICVQRSVYMCSFTRAISAHLQRSDEYVYMLNLTRAYFAHLQTVWYIGDQWTFKWICEFTIFLNLTRAYFAHLQTVWGIGDQWTFIWICAYV